MNLFNSKWKPEKQDRLRASGVDKKENHSILPVSTTGM